MTVFTGAAIYLLAFVAVSYALSIRAHNTLISRKGLDRLSIRIQIFCTVVLCTCSWTFCALQVARNVSSQNSIAYLGHNFETPILNLDAVSNVNVINGIDIACTAMLAINVHHFLSLVLPYPDISPEDGNWGRYRVVACLRALEGKYLGSYVMRASAPINIR